MSYCRWSSDNFKCDIYAYESDFGYEIHVASNRLIGEPPQADFSLLRKENPSKEDLAEFVRQDKVRSEWMDKCEHKDIGLPFDGESYTLDTPQEFYDKMIELAKAGYNFPEYVLDVIQAEINEQSKQ